VAVLHHALAEARVALLRLRGVVTAMARAMSQAMSMPMSASDVSRRVAPVVSMAGRRIGGRVAAAGLMMAAALGPLVVTAGRRGRPVVRALAFRAVMRVAGRRRGGGGVTMMVANVVRRLGGRRRDAQGDQGDGESGDERAPGDSWHAFFPFPAPRGPSRLTHAIASTPWAQGPASPR